MRRLLLSLASERDAETWQQHPLGVQEQALDEIEQWVQPRTGLIGPMQRGEVWFAATPGGDRPVLILTRDPVADRIG